ncbi:MULTISPECIES: outer membrane lipoprotein LolB [Ramlibacter]
MSWRSRLGQAAMAAWLAVLLAACASPPRAPADAAVPADVRTGRLALAVEDQPSQSFSAGFELRGRAEAGSLSLFNPLGGTVAVLRWQPGTAVLESPGHAPRQFASVDAMVQQATGAPVPVTALFDWLAGVNTPVPGWEADLSSVADGRLRAQRRSPPPQADLRLVLDR